MELEEKIALITWLYFEDIFSNKAPIVHFFDKTSTEISIFYYKRKTTTNEALEDSVPKTFCSSFKMTTCVKAAVLWFNLKT